jgi:hypothetical protein
MLRVVFFELKPQPFEFSKKSVKYFKNVHTAGPQSMRSRLCQQQLPVYISKVRPVDAENIERLSVKQRRTLKS